MKGEFRIEPCTESKVGWGKRFLNSKRWIYLHGFNAAGNTLGAIQSYGDDAAIIDWRWHAFLAIGSVIAGVVLFRDRKSL